MSEIKTLKELHDIWRLLPAPTHSDEMLLADIDACIKAVEAEIADRFIELPTDADGVPWTLETESFVDDAGIEVVFSGLKVDCKGRWKILSNCVWHNPSLCRHVKPRMLEDVLEDCINEFSHRCTEGKYDTRPTVAKYADEIRELLGGDAE